MTTDVTWNRLRQMVKKRDHSKCFHCGKVDEKGHCDHLIPLAKGGTDSLLNLVWSCPTCNFEKGSKMPNSMYSNNHIQLNPAKNNSLFEKIILDTFQDFLKYIIPPYPPYGGNFYNVVEYYLIIKEMAEKPRFIKWLRNRLYPISKDAHWALLCIESYNNIEDIIRRIKPKDYVFSYTSCYVCESLVQVRTEDNYINFTWECSQGHKGSGQDMFAEGYLEQVLDGHLKWLKERIISLLEDSFIQGHILLSIEKVPTGRPTPEEDLPDWLKD